MTTDPHDRGLGEEEHGVIEPRPVCNLPPGDQDGDEPEQCRQQDQDEADAVKSQAVADAELLDPGGILDQQPAVGGMGREIKEEKCEDEAEEAGSQAAPKKEFVGLIGIKELVRGRKALGLGAEYAGAIEGTNSPDTSTLEDNQFVSFAQQVKGA